MFFVNIYIKVLSNNIFIIVSNKDNKVMKVESMGSIGFKHKEKKILEGFQLLINQLKTYIVMNN
jgi:ribosomal protein S11